MGRVTGPGDLKLSTPVDDMIIQLETAFSENNFLITDGAIRIIINGNYTTEDRQKVAVEYRNAGWSIVAHISSLENGQPPGATLFTFIKP